MILIHSKMSALKWSNLQFSVLDEMKRRYAVVKFSC